MLPELILEIYSHLGNTDKRRLRQTSKQYERLKIKDKPFLEEYCEDGYPIPEQYIDRKNVEVFVKTNRLDIIKQLKIKRLCELSAKYGNLDILKYAHEHGYFWNVWTCFFAAKNGHLACLQYLHEHGCPWNEWTCEYAAENGHLDCLKYSHEHGCLWNEETCKYASQNGHLDCLQYLHEHGCPGYKKYL
jgi:hypothetical protein